MREFESKLQQEKQEKQDKDKNKDEETSDIINIATTSGKGRARDVLIPKIQLKFCETYKNSINEYQNVVKIIKENFII